jgi:hypothetical protein
MNGARGTDYTAVLRAETAPRRPGRPEAPGIVVGLVNNFLDLSPDLEKSL